MRSSVAQTMGAAQQNIIKRREHCLSETDISNNALKVLSRLQEAGFEAFLVGGGVRDLLLRRTPKDFDIATEARPNQIRKLFRNCRLIGRRFRLAHIYFGREIIEVATFRAEEVGEQAHLRKIDKGLLVRDNVYGSLEDDVYRRDFTINALYYDHSDHSIVDFTDGVKDIKAKVVRIIGDPAIRFQEDPVRMLRAVRFAAKLDFKIDHESEHYIKANSDILTRISPARLQDETLKLFQGGSAEATFHLLREYQLFSKLFPLTEAILTAELPPYALQLIHLTLRNTDQRIGEQKPVTPAFLFAVLLWYPLQQCTERLQKQGESPLPALEQAMSQVISEQCKHTTVPKRYTKVMREIWLLQYRLPKRTGLRPFRVLEHPRFRAAYDFLLLREQAGEISGNLGAWWTNFQEADETEQKKMVDAIQEKLRQKAKRKPKKKN